MKRLALVFLVILFIAQPVSAQEGAEIVVASPQSNQIVQGLVVVLGTITVLGFSSYELSFSYYEDQTGTWFPIKTSSLPVVEGELGVWDTTVLTDGDYSLRLRVFLLDGSFQDATVTDLSVRNYTPVPTPTLTATATAVARFVVPTAQLILPDPATATPSIATPTPLPPNPASLGTSSIAGALTRGALLTFLLFLGLGFVLRLRRD